MHSSQEEEVLTLKEEVAAALALLLSRHKTMVLSIICVYLTIELAHIGIGSP